MRDRRPEVNAELTSARLSWAGLSAQEPEVVVKPGSADPCEAQGRPEGPGDPPGEAGVDRAAWLVSVAMS